jgi:hypothetical protein
MSWPTVTNALAVIRASGGAVHGPPVERRGCESGDSNTLHKPCLSKCNGISETNEAGRESKEDGRLFQPPQRSADDE